MSLAVVCSHFNPAGYREPRRNLCRFLLQLRSLHIPVYVAELAYNQENFFLPEGSYVFHYRTDRDNILWHKENLLNLAVADLPSAYDKIAWVDPDVWFMDMNWVRRADAALDNWPLIQLFSKAAWTDCDGRILAWRQGSAASGALKLKTHPGFAWAARRELWSEAGGLCERAILGGADTLLAAACLNSPIPDYMHYPNALRWLNRASTWVGDNGGVGYIGGVLVHEWHGDIAARNYGNRYKILKNIDIDEVVGRRHDGLLEFSAAATRSLKSDIKRYFDTRQEDSVDVSSVT